ncbi:FCD domain-containing protein [Pseudacidovorax sp. RU35E]|uniref:FCD domain-containing protein n=1 Tax=Pseudacidovorax sp. RU35E TaxID=1907403 RepID=UPI000955B5F6|nr:FCD domain-containing protein [Pseudacidovorax sp. RU35E]SIQ55193.1 transcriptional regulator, GntR family [Pseudacidovorax sp. RU35E]
MSIKTEPGIAPGSAAVAEASSPTLARQTYERLRADVLAGHWQPGRKLLMHELRERYQVGASPLREALNRLASEEWVVHNDQRGFAVAGATQAQLEDLVNTRVAVESLAIGQAFDRRGPEWEEPLVLAFHRLSRTPRSISADAYAENPEWERQHRAFHRALLAGCGSALLLGFCEQLYDQAYRFRQLAARVAYKRRNEQDEHQAIFDAVMRGELEQARALLAEHYRRTASIFEHERDSAGSPADEH